MKLLLLFFFAYTSVTVVSAQDLEVSQYQSDRCLGLSLHESSVDIRTKEQFLEHVRNDASSERCLENMPEVDFEKYVLVGMDINSGYCGVPYGLEFSASENPKESTLDVNVGYANPKGVCRALSSYHLWLLIQKPAGEFELKLKIGIKEDEDSESSSP